MTSAPLGKLVQVDLRLAWQNESIDFTPWLCQHLDELADVLGVPLELVGREVAVNTYYADILARNGVDDSLVLIENQLDDTDHKHLGQIMTYLAGLEARTVVWIAREFSDAHVSAVRWLNDHTDDEFAFFAVRLKVVRIGDSPLAPVVEVLVRPNEWERQLQAVARETKTLTEAGERRKGFWMRFVTRHPDEAQYGEANGATARWRSYPELGLVISLYANMNGVGLFIRGDHGADSAVAYAKLEPHAAALTAATGAPFGHPDKHEFFATGKEVDMSDESQWDDLADWLYDTTKTYERLLAETFDHAHA